MPDQLENQMPKVIEVENLIKSYGIHTDQQLEEAPC